jgi:histone deacetylase 11
VLVASASAYVSLCCIPPASFRATKEPREGRAMNRRVAVVYSQKYQIDLGGAERLHNFDIRKYAKIFLALNTDGFLRPEDVFVPEPVSRADLLRIHTPQYLASLRDPARVARYLEAPIVGAMPAPLLDATVLQPFRYATGGTILAARLALQYGIAINIGGGYHHAKPDKGEGFCVYADMPIAIRTLQAERLVRRVLVVDLDVHQGNGTAVCLAGDRSVFIFDMHQAGIFPVPKEKCDLDVELDAGTGDGAYLALLARHLPTLLDRARPDIVFLQAGCDVLAGDPLAGLALTPRGIVRRDAYVIDSCAGRKVPVVMVTGGGYSPQAWQVQYQSIRRTIETYGLAGERPYPPREPTTKEQLYTK